LAQYNNEVYFQHYLSADLNEEKNTFTKCNWTTKYNRSEIEPFPGTKSGYQQRCGGEGTIGSHQGNLAVSSNNAIT
jgi:hypothetical protein